jgi:hypothetical protein
LPRVAWSWTTALLWSPAISCDMSIKLIKLPEVLVIFQQF